MVNNMITHSTQTIMLNINSTTNTIRTTQELVKILTKLPITSNTMDSITSNSIHLKIIKINSSNSSSSYLLLQLRRKRVNNQVND
jgi:hypothetical protein